VRKIENAAVQAIAGGDIETALEHLQALLTYDRRRAWWAMFRMAAGQTPEDRRDAMLALVARTYIARRTGGLLGARDEEVLRSLLLWMAAETHDPTGRMLTDHELRLLKRWLPGRLRNFMPDLNPHP
jgi:DNA polymerase III delta prime subunit